jgi:aryl-alcohol dehydrogenase-like predicted oxidoreductase
MRFRTIGQSELRVPVVGLGANNFGRRNTLDETRQIVMTALDAGMTFIDTAPAYSEGTSESYVGEVLKGRRHEVVLATKFRPVPEGSGVREHIRASVEASLRRMQTDYIDLLYLHHLDPRTPIEQTLGALGGLIREGAVRFIGSSNFPGWRIVEADWTAKTKALTPFVSAQNEYNLFNRTIEAEIGPACAEYRVGLVASRPLAHGFLTGKYRRGEAPPPGTRLAERQIQKAAGEFDRIDALERFARDRGVGLLDVAIGAVLAHPALSSVVIGATSPSQVKANAAAGDWQPSGEDLQLLWETLADR